MTTASYPLHSVVRRFRSRAGHQRPTLAKVVDVVATWHARSAERQQLQEMDDRLLKDIGITRTDAIAEGSKPFWQA